MLSFGFYFVISLILLQFHLDYVAGEFKTRDPPLESGTTPGSTPDVEQLWYSLMGDHRELSLETYENLIVVDRLIPPHVVARFLEFSAFGILPSGQKTTHQLATDEDWNFFNRPFKEWSSVKSSDSIVGRLMIRVGSYQDDARLVLCAKNIEAIKSRLWGGLTPMSGERWKQKRLDEPINHQTVVEHITYLSAAFAYFHRPEVFRSLRDTFNLMSKELLVFEDALREHLKKDPTPYVVLWREFISDFFTVMTTRTRSWIEDRVFELLEAAREQFETVSMSNHTEYAKAAHLFIEQVQSLNHAMNMADWSIFLDMDGFMESSKSFTPSDLNTERRAKHLTRLFELQNRQDLKLINHTIHTNVGLLHPSILLTAHEHLIAIRNRIQYDYQGKATELAPELGPEPWISRFLELKTVGMNHDETDHQRGFVAYRLTHQQTAEEWAKFTEQLQADLNSWGKWIDGSEQVKGLLTLQWIDGKEAGVADDNLEAARAHFQTFRESHAIRRGMEDGDFVVIDSMSYFHYQGERRNETMAPYGDDGGYVIVVEADFDPNDPEAHLEEAPGYNGHLKVLSNLLWSDVFSQTFYGSESIQGLWPLAMLHPSQVYTGPIVDTQLSQWAFNLMFKSMVFPDFFDFVREKQAEEGSEENPA